MLALMAALTADDLVSAERFALHLRPLFGLMEVSLDHDDLLCPYMTIVGASVSLMVSFIGDLWTVCNADTDDMIASDVSAHVAIDCAWRRIAEWNSISVPMVEAPSGIMTSLCLTEHVSDGPPVNETVDAPNGSLLLH